MSTSPPTSTVTTDAPTTGDAESSSFCPIAECIESNFQFAHFNIEAEMPFALHATCTVVDIGVGIDIFFVELDCAEEGMQTLVGSGFDLEGLLAGHTTVQVRSVNDPTPPGWWHLAVYDVDGELLFGTYDLSPAAPDVTEWFDPLQFDVARANRRGTAGSPCPDRADTIAARLRSPLPLRWEKRA